MKHYFPIMWFLKTIPAKQIYNIPTNFTETAQHVFKIIIIHSLQNATADMMTLDGPACDERFYLDNWKPAASSPAPSASSSVSSDTPSADVESTWRRTSSSGESYDGSCHNMTWRPPTSSHTPTDYSQQQYGSMCSYPSPSSDSESSLNFIINHIISITNLNAIM